MMRTFLESQKKPEMEALHVVHRAHRSNQAIRILYHYLVTLTLQKLEKRDLKMVV